MFSFKERKYPCNSEPLAYTTYDNAVKFVCAVSDLREVVDVYISAYANHENNVKKYYLEFGAWHAMEVREKLNGFPGYDCITFKEHYK